MSLTETVAHVPPTTFLLPLREKIIGALTAGRWFLLRKGRGKRFEP